MRQPKFRGFSLETNSWHYGHGWFKSDYTEEYKLEKGIKDTAILYTDGSPVECELDSMGTFTGVTGIDGKDVYEGDILPYNSVVTYIYGDDHADLGMGIGFYVQRDNFESWRLLEVGEEVEVLGNIYENPELLSR
jgi:uncharacterized phage protein (TIGR01671 family)